MIISAGNDYGSKYEKRMISNQCIIQIIHIDYHELFLSHCEGIRILQIGKP